MEGKSMSDSEKKSKQGSMTRRRFIAGAGAAALSYSIVKPSILRGQEMKKLKLGLIGCGGRGTWIADLFVKHGGYEISAAADYFQDKVDAFGEKFMVPGQRRFAGLDCYKRLLDSKVDAIAIISPPYFHPEQAAAGVDAGVHVYLAKPIAVDVPGCRSVEASGKKARGNKQVFLIDFQTRANEFFVEALKRVHSGAIGDFAFGEASYHAGSPWGGKVQYLEKDAGNPENRLRAWGLDVALSGDIITEQNIHTLDVMSWIMNQEPLYALGTHGHKVRTDKGDCSDHFAVLFQYPNDVGITFSSRQFNGHDSPGGIRNRMFGSKGVLETEYGGTVLIRGDDFYRGGATTSIYTDGAANNIATFYDSVMNGSFDNPTIEPSVRSNLITILGREAAFDHNVVTWKKMLDDAKHLEPNLKGLRS